MIDIVIPKLGMTMKEGTIVEWVAADGAEVQQDDLVFVMSTDKLDTDVYAEASGTVRHRAKAGETHPVGAVVGVILADGEAWDRPASSNGSSPAPAAQATGRVVASPYARRLACEASVDLAAVRGTGPGGRIVAADVTMATTAPAPPAAIETPVSATPVARRLADKLGVELATVAGTGPGGRITKEDVEGAAAERAPVLADSRSGGGGGSAKNVTVPLRGMRKVIAERMHSSLHEMAQLTLGMEVDVTDAALLRRTLNEECAAEGVRVTFTDLVCWAAVRALGEHPGLNASVEGDAIHLHAGIHLGLAVSVPDGLLVPVVRDADRLSLVDLSASCARLAGACRDGTVSVDALDGSTFTVTALGASGVDFFTPVINPPNVAILGIGRVHDGVAWEGERPVRRQLMTLSLTIDHRAVDGAPGAAFLTSLKALLESPYRLLV